MKKIIPAILLCLTLTGPCFAQNNIEAMRYLTVTALMQYGLKLYDRGNFDEATAVFNHVLSYDDHQAQALEYLKDMGRLPGPGVVSVPVPPVVSTADTLDTESLKKAIEDKRQEIEELRAQVARMRADLAPLQDRRGPA